MYDKGRLKTALQDYVDKNNVSLREIGRQSGISHSTIARIARGEDVKISTAFNMAKWLNIEASNLLPGANPEEDLIKKILVLLRNPEIAKELAELVDEIDRGEVDPSVLRKALEFARFRTHAK